MASRLLTLVFVLVAALPAAAQGGHGPSALERWRELSPERRAELRERFRAWQDMDEVERAELRARHERLREAEGRVRRELDPATRAELEGLGPAERREFLREHLADEFSRCGRRVASLLPDDVRARLEAADPEERMRLMRELRARNGAERLARGLDALANRLGLPEDERASFDALSHEERKAKLYELRRREIVERVEREGPPSWMGAEEWAELQTLDDRAFCERLRRCRSGGRGDDSTRELWRLLRPDPEWIEQHAPASEPERRAAIEGRIAERALEWLERHPDALPELDRAALRALAPGERLQRVRDAWRAGQPPRRPSRRGH